MCLWLSLAKYKVGSIVPQAASLTTKDSARCVALCAVGGAAPWADCICVRSWLVGVRIQ